MKWKVRLGAILLGAYILLQGVENLRAHNYAYWNVSRRLVLYPETQIIFGAAAVLLAVLPLRRIILHITRPYLNHPQQPDLRPFWKRRHKQKPLDVHE